MHVTEKDPHTPARLCVPRYHCFAVLPHGVNRQALFLSCKLPQSNSQCSSSTSECAAAARGRLVMMR